MTYGVSSALSRWFADYTARVDSGTHGRFSFLIRPSLPEKRTSGQSAEGGLTDRGCITAVLQVTGVAWQGRIGWSRFAVTAITVLILEGVHSLAREEKAVRFTAQPAMSLLRLTPTRRKRFVVGTRIPTLHRERLPFRKQCFPASFPRFSASAPPLGPLGALAFSKACEDDLLRIFRSCLCPSRATLWRG